MKALIASGPQKGENRIAVSNSEAVCRAGKLGSGGDRVDVVQKIQQQSSELIYESYYGEGMAIFMRGEQRHHYKRNIHKPVDHHWKATKQRHQDVISN